MLYKKEIVHSPRQFEQWHFSNNLINAKTFQLSGVREGGYGVHDIDFWVERIKERGFAIIVLCISGRGKFHLEDDSSFILYPGDAFISYPDGQGHREETLGPEPFEHLWLGLDATSPLLSSYIEDYKIIQYEGSNLLRELSRTMVTEDFKGESKDSEIIDLAERMIIRIVQNTLEAGSEGTLGEHKAKLAKMFNYVSQHLENPWSVNDLCLIANCSRSHLTRLCRMLYNQSPGEKVREMKMEYAKTLLIHSVLPIKAIAEYVGFANTSLFSTAFLSYEGISPREYRKKG